MQIQYLNNLRALACFLVVLTHSAMPALSPDFGVFMVFFSLVASPSSELFVTISSSLLAPTKLSMFEFYRKRFSKLLWPFLFWSIFIVIFRLSVGQINVEDAVRKLLFFPLFPVEGVYWFVYVICGLYLLIPIISPWLNIASRKELLFAIGIWGITLVLPYLNIITGKAVYSIKGDYYFILNYLGGFIGFMLMGVYLRKYPFIIKNKMKAIVIIGSLIILGTLPVLFCYIFNREAILLLTDNLSLTSALYVAAIFFFFQNFNLPVILEKWVNEIAKYSFGIYLIHILVVRELVWSLLKESRIGHPLLETPFIAVISIIICWLFVKILSLFPKSKYIIGS